MKHEPRIVGHVSGWQERTGHCRCGKVWPCIESFVMRMEDFPKANLNPEAFAAFAEWAAGAGVARATPSAEQRMYWFGFLAAWLYKSVSP